MSSASQYTFSNPCHAPAVRKFRTSRRPHVHGVLGILLGFYPTCWVRFTLYGEFYAGYLQDSGMEARMTS